MMQLIMSIHLEKYPEERFSSSSQIELCSPSYYEQRFMAQEEVEPHAKWQVFPEVYNLENLKEKKSRNSIPREFSH